MCVNRLFAAGKTEKQPDHDSKYDTECQEIAGKRCINCKKEGATGDDDEDSLPVPAHGKFVVVDAGMRFIAALHTCAPPLCSSYRCRYLEAPKKLAADER